MPRFTPTYSLGGTTSGGWTAVPGTSSTATGNPIDIGGSNANPANWPVFEVFCASGTATVLIEANGGELDSTSNPPSGEWIDISNGGYAMTSNTHIAKRVPPNVPYVRTRLTALSGATVTSYIPAVCDANGQWMSARHPNKNSSSVA